MDWGTKRGPEIPQLKFTTFEEFKNLPAVKEVFTDAELEAEKKIMLNLHREMGILFSDKELNNLTERGQRRLNNFFKKKWEKVKGEVSTPVFRASLSLSAPSPAPSPVSPLAPSPVLSQVPLPTSLSLSTSSLLSEKKDPGLNIEQARIFLDILRQKYNLWDGSSEDLKIKEAFLEQYFNSPQTQRLIGEDYRKWLNDFTAYITYICSVEIDFFTEASRVYLQNVFAGDIDKGKLRSLEVIFNRFLNKNPQEVRDALKKIGVGRIIEPAPAPVGEMRAAERGITSLSPLETRDPGYKIAEGIIKSASGKNQFSSGGISSCTYNAILMAIQLMDGQEPSSDLIDKVLQESGKMHSGPEHTDFIDADNKIKKSEIYGKLMNKIDTEECHFSILGKNDFTAAFGDGESFKEKVNKINKFPWACVITKAPESMMLFQRAKNSPIFLYDSHGRSGAAYILSFKNIEQVYKYLKTLFSYEGIEEDIQQGSLFQSTVLEDLSATFMTFK